MMEKPVRLLVQPARDHLAAMALHVEQTLQAGARVLFVTADRPFRVLRDAFAHAGVEAGDVFFLDVISAAAHGLPKDPSPDVVFLASPTMLEMIAMRIEQMSHRLGPETHMVLDSLNALSLYNGVPALHEFTHYLVNRLKLTRVAADLVVRPNEEGRRLVERLGGVVDEVATGVVA